MIIKAVEYCAADMAIVAAYGELESHQQTPDFWSDKTLEKLKSRVKDHYIEEQGVRCCYCNKHLNSKNHRVWDIEHIACRAKHARFMFEPKNLAASCPDCNLSKGDKEVLVNPRRKTYPVDSKGFKIIHPHYDIYDQHISYKEFVYVPISEKGKFTIYTCDLLRFTVSFLDMKGSAADTSFEEEVNAAFNAKADPVLADLAIELIELELSRNGLK